MDDGTLEISPTELSFSESSKATLTLKNTYPDTSYIMFKVKTNSINSYTVRPNACSISPGCTAEVQIMQRQKPTKRVHKFLLQWTTSIRYMTEAREINSYLDESQSTKSKMISVAGLTSERVPATPDSAVFAPPMRSPSTYSPSVDIDNTALSGSSTLLPPRVETGSPPKEVDESLSSKRDERDVSHVPVHKVHSQLATCDNMAVSQGVSVRMTALLCLLSFILGYVFF